MSTNFRIDGIGLVTAGGEVAYDFRGPLTILDGPVATGKSTMVELIKHGLGGSARFSPVVKDHVTSVRVRLSAGRERFELSRSTFGGAGVVYVRDLRSREDLGAFPVEPTRGQGDETQTVGKLLLTALGLPTDVRASALSSKATSKPSVVTFNDIWSSLYVEQPEIDRSIAHHSDTYREPKRRTVFELFFGITDKDLLALKSSLQDAEQVVLSAESEEATILEFLKSVGAEPRDASLAEQEKVRVQLGRYRARLQSLASEADPADPQTDVLRDLLLTTQDRADDLKRELSSLEKVHEERLGLAAGIRQDLARLKRAQDAGARLADIEFVICPRCTQSLEHRSIPDGHCRLCLQADTDYRVNASDEPYEVIQMRVQQAETEELIAASSGRIEQLRHSLSETEEHAKKLALLVDERSRELVSPRLQEYADVSEAIGMAEERIKALDERLRYWDRAGDISRVVQRARDERNSLKDEVVRRESSVELAKKEVLSALTEEYARTLSNFGVPGVNSVRIDDRTYLPYVNGDRFDKISTGGLRTALVVAYWVTLISVALRDSASNMPACLVLDSPRKSIGAGEALAANLYSQLDILAESYKGRVQIIVADNGVPAEYAKRWQRLSFSYQEPVIRSVKHPGPAEVVTLDRLTSDRNAA
ncbi:hypothetical protein FJK98_26065 [Micromonospora sp. HM134]|uniref:hypothetical protein n=1 Tax=Micromonospora sp. HM134 TaxID=2583243 RepID=UPI00119876E6|nr:hypothetical protein [Micromonospora sp. HM134]QDY10187.1 hypothetical protein FJK98_26065 [Micromonospora sp. HM134]